MRKLASLLIACCLCVIQVWAQNRPVTGRVTDENGTAVPGVSVSIKGTQIGTSTNADGTFTISVPTTAKTFIFSGAGFTGIEKSIGNTPNITVVLNSISASLDNVVVQVPYGTVKKTAFTGSESTVNSNQIRKQQVTSINNVLEGLVPGISATNGGGAPGGSSSAILIRGVGSINASAGPLYVLNGVIYDGSIISLPTDDIESVTVLKDASAAALYGSRAANGVILITTKKGKRGTPAVNINVRQGILSRGIPEYDRLGAKDYYELMWEASKNSLLYGTGLTDAAARTQASATLTDANHLVYNSYSVPTGQYLVDPTTGKLNTSATQLWDESWSDALYRTAARTNANINISGASDKSDYYLSAGYLNEDGIVKFSGYKRYTTRLSVNTNATDWLRSGITLDGAYGLRRDVPSGGTATTNPFYYTRQMGPIYPVYQHNTTTGATILDAAGNPALDWGIPTQMGTRPYAGNSNLLGSLNLDDRSRSILNGNANAYADAKFLKDFHFKTTFGINLLDVNITTYQNSQYGDAQNVRGRSTKEDQRQISYTLNEVLSWSKNIGDHSISALAGHENYFFKFNDLNLTRTGFNYPGQTELDNATITESVGGSYEDNSRIESYFANANYTFKNKYLLSGSIRTDGSSRFADSVRWGQFYSVGAGWRITQESFLKGVKWLNELKLKGSYGESGNENIGLYYQYNNYYSANGTGSYTSPTRVNNPELKWEKNKILNVGFDYSMFNNRIQGSLEYYTRTTSDLLFDVPLPPSRGGSVYRNIGEMQNRGVELQLGYNAIRKKNFDWRIDVNVAHFKNEITKLPPTQEVNGIVSGTKKLFVGRSIYEFWLREYAGVDASTGEALYYKDVMGTDGKPNGQRVLTNNYSQASYYFEGTAIPKVSGGVTNSFRYKNFDLSVLTTFSYGGKFYDGNLQGIMHSGSYGTAWSSDILNRWQKPGDVTNVPKVQNGVANQDGTSTRWLVDGSYLNIKNITLSYSLPRNWLSKVHMSGVQIYGNVDNAYLFSAKKGMDPQRSFTGTADATYVPFRTVTFGLNVNL